MHFRRCSTCGQNAARCFGHFGYINLHLPLFNPLLTANVFTLLRSKCFACHKLLISDTERGIFIRQMQLLDRGEFTRVFSENHEQAASDPEILSTRQEQHYDQNDVFAQLKLPQQSSLANEARRKVVREFLQLCTSRNHFCPNTDCGASIPSITKDDGDRTFKVFMQPLSERKIKNAKLTNPSTREQIPLPDKSERRYLSPLECFEHINRLWQEDATCLNLIYPQMSMALTIDGDGDGDTAHPRITVGAGDVSIFFLRVLLVPPNRFRPPNIVNGMINDHGQNIYFRKIIENNNLIVDLQRRIAQGEQVNPLEVQERWLQVQRNVGLLFDHTPSVTSVGPAGIKQLLEKKQGMFRKFMMGKRVNYAARSVISPDPYIMTNEIGLNEYFAMNLTFAEPVTEFNFKRLAEAVLNGSEKYPGANFWEDENGNKFRIPADEEKRAGIAKALCTHPVGKVKKVYRHLIDGDVVLLNRQPTLHKPSIMGHIVRVLRGLFLFRSGSLCFSSAKGLHHTSSIHP
jgi:DNA-directed RNA polymerase I subunit RPA1